MKFVSQLLLLTHCPVDARQISSSPEESGSGALKRALFSPRRLGKRKNIKKFSKIKKCFEHDKSYTGTNAGEKKKYFLGGEVPRSMREVPQGQVYI